eukprot:3082300-Rhodomonas_salina.1
MPSKRSTPESILRPNPLISVTDRKPKKKRELLVGGRVFFFCGPVLTEGKGGGKGPADGEGRKR